MDDKLRGTHTFREFYDYLLRAGQIETDEFDYELPEHLKTIKKLLMPNLKENSIIVASTPNEENGFFYKLWKETVIR